jgi:hypothetical protein
VLHVPALRNTFRNARDGGETVSKVPEGPATEHPAALFANGATWVRNVLVPAIAQGNAELQPENVAFHLDLNLDAQSTNHPHADLWLAEAGEGERERAVGPKYSINVIGGKTVWLYRPGVPGHILGTLDECGPDAIQELLGKAADEFGKQIGKLRRVCSG